MNKHQEATSKNIKRSREVRYHTVHVYKKIYYKRNNSTPPATASDSNTAKRIRIKSGKVGRVDA